MVRVADQMRPRWPIVGQEARGHARRPGAAMPARFNERAGRESGGSAGGTGSQGKPAAGNGGVGVPDDAVSAFAKAITDAGKAALEETGDPNVSVAFQLGWTIEIITNSRETTRSRRSLAWTTMPTARS